MKTRIFKNVSPRFFPALRFLFGAIGYGLIELLWRGRTHPTMLLAGGVCFCLYYKLCEDAENMPLCAKCALGAILITSVELIFGTVFNVWLSMNVWDYSKMPLHFYGQICLPFYLLWFLLCLPLTRLCDGIREKTK